MREKTDARAERRRYGIGEWYGWCFARIPASKRRLLAEAQTAGKKGSPLRCLPRGGAALCTKEGGVCSIRMYQQAGEGGEVSVAAGDDGRLVTICPARFDEDGAVFRWIGEYLLGSTHPLVVREVGFLEREAANVETHSAREDVGRIDNVLVRADSEPMLWCALEMQAVYFSGQAMSHEFRHILEQASDAIPFPAKLRRPDYRSSGPKRLMPQLQIKVPTLRRWGKKMAVVVDESFFGALGQMDSVSHVSNADIAWFVVKYEDTGERARLVPAFHYLTTLERAVEGLTAGHPVSLDTFEARIKEKLKSAGVRPPS